jgi:predicted transcriptional regulator
MTKVFVDTDDNFRHYSRMAPKPPKPTEAELVILQVLWDGGPRSVRDILHVLQTSKPTGYTTALKMLQIMTEKGLVDRDDNVRPQIYRARYSREHTQKRMLTDLLDRAFGGSVKALVLQALSSKKSTPEEMADIERLLDRLEESTKGHKK